MLVSKAGLLTTLILLIWLFWQWLKQKKYILVLGLTAFVVFGSFGVYKSSKHVSNRIDEFFEGIGDGPTDNHLYSTSIRLVVWDLAWQNVKQSPVYGYGTGDVGDVLLKDYLAQDIVKVKDLNLNAHNQFLQTSLAIGILGGLLLLAILFYPLIKRDRQVELYTLFLLNTLFFFFSESVLETQAGTVGFTLFYLLYFSIAKQPEIESN
jgi:O-antigen ligase